MADDKIKLCILRNIPCQPEGPFPRDEKNRCFSAEFYYRTSKKGSKILRRWLCYSPKMDRVYCEPCWLFGERKSVCQSLLTVGINDWQGLSRKTKEHELTRSDLSACVIYDTWKQNLTVDAQMSSAYAQEVSYWTEVLTRIVDVTLTLASCNAAFRGYREKNW